MRTRPGSSGPDTMETRVIYYVLQELWAETDSVAHITVSPATANFGTVAVASTALAQAFIVSNAGSENLSIGSIGISGQNALDFALETDHCSGHTLVPANTCTLLVAYSPATAGSKSAALLIPSDDPGMPTVSVGLNGVATASISGSVTSGGSALAGVIMTLNGTAQQNTTTDISGTYAFAVLLDGVYTVTPGKTGYGFSPAVSSLSIGGNIAGVNFTGAINIYTVTPSAGSGGSISPSTPQTVNYNGTTSFTITPNAGYNIASVTGCGGSLAGGTYTTGPITGNCSVTTSFSPITYTITATGGANGGITPSGTVSVNYGASQTFNIAPNKDNRIVSVVVDGVSQGAISSYTFTNVTTNHTISVNFTMTSCVFGATGITMSGGYVDSYDSTKGSYNGIHGSNGPVGTNSILAGAITMSGGSTIYGDAFVGPGGNPSTVIIISGGAVIDGGKSVLSAARDMTPKVDPGGGTTTTFTNGTTLTSGTYRVSSINLSGTGVGTINGNVTLYVTGSVSLSGTSKIVILTGGSLTLYVSGSFNVSGSGIVNQTLNPHNLTVYGTSTCTSANYSGSSALYGSIYAPKASVALSGTAGVYGSVVGSSVTMSGGAIVHCDESL